MALQTSIANALDHAGDEAELDKEAKKIFSHLSILAPLLRMCVPEFAGFTDQFIIQNCFVDTPHISTFAVHQDVNDKLNGNIRVTQMNSEDSSADEHTVFYDIRFTVKVPYSDQLIRMIINVEIQAIDKQTYKVVTRGIYYCARMISAQFGTVFTDSEYEKIQKVYSIWICPDSYREENSITEYRMTEFPLLGAAKVDKSDYDKLQVIVITLTDKGTESDNPLIRFLSLILSNELSLESRKSALEDDYKIQMDENLEKEMNIVCNLGEGIARKNLGKGISIGEDKLGTLMSELLSAGRISDAQRAANEPDYREKMYKAFNMTQESVIPTT